MSAQLKRSGIYRNTALSLAWFKRLLLSNFKITIENHFPHTTVLLGVSSVKKLTELYDSTKLLCFGICWYPYLMPDLCDGVHWGPGFEEAPFFDGAKIVPSSFQLNA